jgi:hypothetical protein
MNGGMYETVPVDASGVGKVILHVDDEPVCLVCFQGGTRVHAS